MFSQAVDKTSAQTIGNYLLNNVVLTTGTGAGTGAAVLESDGKTVIITLGAALANDTNNVYQVNPITSAR